MTTSRLLLFSLAAILSAACSDDPTEPAPPDGGDLGPAYLVATRIWDDISTTSYFHVVPTTEANAEIDPKRAIEVPGAAKLLSIGEVGWFAIGGGEAPTITRYTLEGDALVEGDAISLQKHGVGSLWNSVYVVSETKAYYPDREGHQLIV